MFQQPLRRRSPAPAAVLQDILQQPPVPQPPVPSPPPMAPYAYYTSVIRPVIVILLLVALVVLPFAWPAWPEFGLNYITFGRCVAGIAVLVGLWGYWVACRAAALRAQLRLLFPDILAPASWVDLSRVDLTAFGHTKGVTISKPLLWTAQAEALWLELKTEATGDVFRGQILAGPSGIGKSHIALLLALRCYALGIPVLYVPDAGELLDKCIAYPSPLDMRSFLNASLLRSFAIRNLDVAPTALFSLICAAFLPTVVSVHGLLHSCNAVVVIDEHGHAYNTLMRGAPRLSPSSIFPLLMPNSYLDSLRVRCVFAGSNQAQFEGELNGTYAGCMRFVVPFDSGDAVLFLSQLLRVAPTSAVLASYERWSNFVPGEMVRLSLEVSPVIYVSKRRGVIAENLRRMADLLGTGTTQHFNMVRVLDNFFGKSSMAMGIETYSFLDFGYVYRRGHVGVPITAHPLCYPATLALMDLWYSVSKAPGPLLADVFRDRDGAGFENLVWNVLLARGFHGGAVLPCHRLGDGTPIQQLQLKLTDYFVSQLVYHNTLQSTVNAEVALLMKRCQQLNMTLLYRCPVGCADVDFFILHSDGTCDALQTSLSVLTQHSREGGTVAAITGITPRYNIPAAKLRYYIYITQQREVHPRLAASLGFVRIVDAELWIRS